MILNNLNSYDWLWAIWWVYFAVVEGIGVFHEAKNKNDDWTLTHFLVVLLPMSARVAILVWLAIHFLIEHKVS